MAKIAKIVSFQTFPGRISEKTYKKSILLDFFWRDFKNDQGFPKNLFFCSRPKTKNEKRKRKKIFSKKIFFIFLFICFFWAISNDEAREKKIFTKQAVKVFSGFLWVLCTHHLPPPSFLLSTPNRKIRCQLATCCRI